MLRIYDDPGEVSRLVDLQHAAERTETDDPVVRVERTPTVAVLSTLHDERADWVRAAQAVERVLLEATGLGLAASFMNQPLEDEALRGDVRSPASGVGRAQMIMRIGYGDPVPATPRRPLPAVRRHRSGST